MKKRICFPPWIIYTISIVALLAGLWFAYSWTYGKGQDSLACAPSPDWGGMRIDCYEASFRSGVFCPCNEHTISCYGILSTHSYSPEEKRQKVIDTFGTQFRLPKFDIEDCDSIGVCPVGECAAWDLECEWKSEDSWHDDSCCMKIIKY